MRPFRRNRPAAPKAEEMIDLRAARSRPREAERTTRRRLDPWDRSKYLVLCSVLFGFFWWQKLAGHPIKSVADGFWETVEQQTWIWVLAALEAARQTHFLLAERWAAYYRS